MSNFNLYSKYYNLLYEDKNTSEECDYVIDLIRDNGFTGNKWLEYGSGSGRHGMIFEKKGIDWEGVDRSKEMAMLGISDGLKISVADIGKEIIPNEEYDTVLALFHVISYLVDNNSLLRAFKNAYSALKIEGAFVFDVWYSPAVYEVKPERRIKNVTSKDIDVERTATPTINNIDNTVNVHYDIEVVDNKTLNKEHFSEDHLMRHFSIPELKLLAKVSGFEFLHAEEWVTKNRPNENTWGVTCVLKKIDNL